MNKIRDFLSRPIVTVALFALALVLLGGSTVGGARAALTIESQDYNSEIGTSHIGVALVENTKRLGDDGKLLGDLLSRNGDTALKTGKHYKEELAVENTGAIDAYVRVTVYKYWLDEQGNKYPAMDPQWIKLGLNLEDGWSEDEDETTATPERTVLYYSPVLPSGKTSSPFLTHVYIDNKAGRQVTQSTENNVITTTYVYNNKSFCLEVHVDGVQTHSADRAKLSAWGVNK